MMPLQPYLYKNAAVTEKFRHDLNIMQNVWRLEGMAVEA